MKLKKFELDQRAINYVYNVLLTKVSAPTRHPPDAPQPVRMINPNLPENLPVAPLVPYLNLLPSTIVTYPLHRPIHFHLLNQVPIGIVRVTRLTNGVNERDQPSRFIVTKTCPRTRPVRPVDKPCRDCGKLPHVLG